MPRKARDYAAEYQRRNQLAQQRGFKSYGQQRHYTEYTGTPAAYITRIQPEEIAETYQVRGYDYADYEHGEDRILDAWIRRSEGRGVNPEDAYRTYMRQARGGRLSREQVKRLAQREYGLDWNEQWDTSR